MTTDFAPTSHPNDDGSLTAEVRALMGVYALYTKVEVAIEKSNLTDGLSDQVQHLLVQLEKPQRLGDLARNANMLPSSITALADALESHGLAQRHRDDQDRRVWVLALTQKGVIRRTEMLQKASELFQNISGLNDEETHAFAAICDTVRKNIYDKSFQEN